MSPLQSKDAELFVYLSWRTHAGYSFIDTDEARQVAYQAMAAATRFQFCHLLAIDGTPCRIHLICRFPASLSISNITRTAQIACAEGVSRLWQAIEPGRRPPHRLWEPAYTARTLCPMTVAEAQAYLRQQSAESKLEGGSDE